MTEDHSLHDLPTARRRLFAVLAPTLAILFVVVAAEAFLWLWEPSRAPAESALDYGDTWRKEGLGPGGFLEPGFDGRVVDGYGGTVRWQTNALGFRNIREISPMVAPKTLRILSLGDSFTAGYRVDQKQTFSYLLESASWSRHGFEDTEALVAVIEDPVTGLYYLTRHALAFRPKIVLLGLTVGNDIAQAWAGLHPLGSYRLTGDARIIIENPSARPQELGRLAATPQIPEECVDGHGRPPSALKRAGDGPSSRLLAKVQQVWGICRADSEPQTVVSTWNAYRRPRLFDSNGLGVFLRHPPELIETSYDKLAETLRGYNELASRHDFLLVIALFPQRYQVQPRDWQETIKVYGLNEACFDLKRPNRRLAELASDAGLLLLDPTRAMAAAYAASGVSLYLPRGDMHWNRHGHRAFADFARRSLEPVIANLP